MGTITQKTLDNMKKQLPVNWSVDMQALIYRNEKEPQLKIKSTNNEMVVYSLMYTERRNGFRWLPNYDVKLNKSVWTRMDSKDSMWTCHGLGTTIKIRDDYSEKKNFKKLCELAKEYDTQEKLDSLFDNNNIKHCDNTFGGVLINE